VQSQHQAHLLQHVAIIVAAGLVDADGHAHAPRLEGVQRRYGAPDPQIGTAVVADA
jgi:hypothetical protein